MFSESKEMVKTGYVESLNEWFDYIGVILQRYVSPSMAATLNSETNGLWDKVSGEIEARPDGCMMGWIIESHFGSGTRGKPMHEYSLREAIWQTMDMECSDPHHAQVNLEKLRKIKRLLEDPKLTKEQIVEAIIKHSMIYDMGAGCLESIQNDARDIPILSAELMSRSVAKVTIQIAEDGRRSESTVNMQHYQELVLLNVENRETSPKTLGRPNTRSSKRRFETPSS